MLLSLYSVSVVYFILYQSLHPHFACANLIPSSLRTETEKERGRTRACRQIEAASHRELCIKPVHWKLKRSPAYAHNTVLSLSISLSLFPSYSSGNSCFFSPEVHMWLESLYSGCECMQTVEFILQAVTVSCEDICSTLSDSSFAKI